LPILTSNTTPPNNYKKITLIRTLASIKSLHQDTLHTHPLQGGKPCNDIGICKIELGPDERIQKIRLFIDELLDPLLASLYRSALLYAGHGSLANN